MGRASIQVKCIELQQTINELEKENKFDSIGDLCSAISNTEWAKGVKNSKHRVVGLSAQMVYIKIKELKCSYSTPKGRRGRQVGTSVSKTSREKKLSGKIDDFTKLLLRDTPEKYKHLAEQSVKGNIISAVKLMCGQCMGFSGAEKACTGCLSGTPCAIYPINLLVYPNRRTFTENKDGFYTTKRDIQE